MLEPRDLYDLGADLPEFEAPVLLYSFDGFVDAGGIGGLVREQFEDDDESTVLARFDVDSLLDYRSRRPVMLYVEDHWESYEAPEIVLRAMRDSEGTPFLLLTGPEPDYQWERFVAAVGQLVERFDVRLTAGFHGIPMAVPHTRPIGVTAHATRAELVADHTRWLNRVQVPGSVAALLELRLGAAGRDALGFAVHVPHYLAQAAYPAAALAALEAVNTATGLALPLDKLRTAGQRADTQIAQQVEESEEISNVVRTLEQQYDSYVAAQERDSLRAGELADMPTADELGAEFERFLAEQERRRDTPDF